MKRPKKDTVLKTLSTIAIVGGSIFQPELIPLTGPLLIAMWGGHMPPKKGTK